MQQIHESLSALVRRLAPYVRRAAFSSWGRPAIEVLGDLSAEIRPMHGLRDADAVWNSTLAFAQGTGRDLLVRPSTGSFVIAVPVAKGATLILECANVGYLGLAGAYARETAEEIAATLEQAVLSSEE